MAFKLAEHTHQAGPGLTALHLHESKNGRNSAVYVIVPTGPQTRRVAAPKLTKSAKAAAKQALLNAAEAL